MCEPKLTSTGTRAAFRPPGIALAIKGLPEPAKKGSAEVAIADGMSGALFRLKALVVADSRDETRTPPHEFVVVVGATVGR